MHAPVPTAGPIDLRQVFQPLPGPVAVVTGTGPAGELVAMTVSSFTSASLAPPLVLFCPSVTSRTWATARDRGRFALNVLGDDQGALAQRFAGPGDRFAGVRLVFLDDDVPVLADALAVLVCDVGEEYPAGDHTVVLGRVRRIVGPGGGRGLDTRSLRAAGAAPPGARLRPLLPLPGRARNEEVVPVNGSTGVLPSGVTAGR